MKKIYTPEERRAVQAEHKRAWRLRNPDWYKKRNASGASLYGRRSGPENREKPVDIPPGVLAERERRYEIEATVTAHPSLGDPLPGYSALDRKQFPPLVHLNLNQKVRTNCIPVERNRQHPRRESCT